MRRVSRIIAAVLAATAWGASPGCSGGHSWGTASSGVSGLNEGGSTYIYTFNQLSCDGRVYLILAVDGCSGGDLIGGPTARGQYVSPSGRKVAWSCSTADGRAGTVTI